MKVRLTYAYVQYFISVEQCFNVDLIDMPVTDNYINFMEPFLGNLSQKYCQDFNLKDLNNQQYNSPQVFPHFFPHI